MLYNILPPLVFFASLGGAIYIVSRVILRARRQSLATAETLSHSNDLAKLLGPSQKSVHVIKNRLVHAGQIFSQLRQRVARRIVTITPSLALLQKVRRLFSFRARRTENLTQEEPLPVKPVPTLRIVEKKLIKPAKKDSLTEKLFTKKAKATPLDAARQHLNACRYDSAEKALVPFLVKHPKNTHAYMLLGKVALGRRDWEEASEVFEQVINIKPSTKGCYAALGYANYKAGKLTKALESLKKAHDADPHNIIIIKRLLSIARRLDLRPLQHSLTDQLADLESSAKQ